VQINDIGDDIYLFSFIKRDDGFIYYIGDLDLDWPDDKTGNFEIDMYELAECDYDEDLTILVLAYDEDISEILDVYRDDIECSWGH
jgi:hypothetical protein